MIWYGIRVIFTPRDPSHNPTLENDTHSPREDLSLSLTDLIRNAKTKAKNRQHTGNSNSGKEMEVAWPQMYHTLLGDHCNMQSILRCKSGLVAATAGFGLD